MADRYRVRVGDKLQGFVMSSLVTGLKARFQVIYDDGTDDYASVALNATAGDRTLETFNSEWQAKKRGEVVSGVVAVTGTLPKRGQCYVAMWVVDGEGGGVNTKEQTIGDYAFGLHTPTLGRIVEPGPGGGDGVIRSISVASTELVAAGNIIQAVPTNATWKTHSLDLRYTATATVGTRNVLVYRRDGTTIKEYLAREDLTASQVGDFHLYSRAIGEWNDTSGTRSGANVIWYGQISDYPMPEAYDFFIEDLGDVDVTAPADAFVAELVVEEWLVL